MRLRTILAPAVVLAAVLATAHPVRADFARGLAALQRGEYPLALKELLPDAQGGNPRAQYEIGRMYRYGWGVEPNAPESARWFSMAAAQGVIAATYELAWMYHMGDGVRPDARRAAELFGLGADAGHGLSTHYLGILRYEGRGVPRDFAMAARLFATAADLGVGASFIDLGLLYHRGEGVTADSIRATRLFRMGADLGDGRGMLILGGAYARGEGVMEDPAEAYFWYGLAIGHGAPDVRNRAEQQRRDIASALSADERRFMDARIASWEPAKISPSPQTPSR
ncbi:MAG: sel1 repeat family protein [Rhodospirillales bacterium]|nr:sel1 repeat family protein [Rhodospirillales bacterium]